MTKPIKPNRYIAQSGIGCWAGGGFGGVGGSDWADSFDADDADADLVVKAPTALQAL